jgi:hypothetical protein
MDRHTFNAFGQFRNVSHFALYLIFSLTYNQIFLCGGKSDRCTVILFDSNHYLTLKKFMLGFLNGEKLMITRKALYFSNVSILFLSMEARFQGRMAKGYDI